MDFGMLPPEVNSGRMYTGPGAGSILAAAAAWDDLAANLHSTASSYQSVVAGLTSGPWKGPASAAMAAAAAPYVTWMSTTATQAEQTADQARAAAAAYEAAFAMTVPPPVIAANRAQLMALIATNFLGQNTPAIMATEAHYAEMWAQDAAAMYGYSGASATASAMTPFSSPPQSTNPNALAGQSATMAHSSATAAGNQAHHMTSSLSSVSQTLQNLASPGTSQGGLTQSGVPQMVVGTETSAATSAASAPASALTGMTGATSQGAVKTVSKSADASGSLGGLAAAAGGGDFGLVEDTIGLGEDGVGLVALDGGGVGLDLIGVGLDFLGADELTESGGLGALGALPLGGGLGGLGGLGAGLGQMGGVGAAASVGQAASISGLSVPATWTGAMPVDAINPATAIPATAIPASAMAVPAANLGGVPATASTAGSVVPKLTLPGVSGREVDGAIRAIGFRSSVIPHSPMAG